MDDILKDIERFRKDIEVAVAKLNIHRDAGALIAAQLTVIDRLAAIVKDLAYRVDSLA